MLLVLMPTPELHRAPQAPRRPRAFRRRPETATVERPPVGRPKEPPNSPTPVQWIGQLPLMRTPPPALLPLLRLASASPALSPSRRRVQLDRRSQAHRGDP